MDQTASGLITKDVDDMAASLYTQEESGTYRARPRRKHDGYYAGDFSGQPIRLLTYKDGQYETRVVLPAS